ncbi:alpha/beta hydrolase [Jeongeupia sp. HS-3]|uniref:alpha/beta hydrolase n=1 Tax=Jeongeupia sp. HS-3 TaxID=1009682 RepID=UPI0018A4F2E4|nr:alpha/beta hydrolase [Jeongeupia sp. HS-3]BCL77312.1 alpha/beta hydrolase [Jeongeupia sp. HS-3]
MNHRHRMLIALLSVSLPLLGLALAIIFGGPSRPAPMGSINDPFKSVDFSDLPPISTFQAPDGQLLAYREYAPTAAQSTGSVTLVHGSSASSNSMHPMAKALAAAGHRVYALDIRGHGASGIKGQIGFIGQLESDLEAFVQAVHPPAPATLAGFSSGGGFVLRFAASEHRSRFNSYLLLSPFISQDAPNQRPDSGGWANVGVPRIVGLVMLNALGVHTFNHLPVTRFALNDKARSFLTPEYGFNLAMNFRPLSDFEANIRSVDRPCAIVAGTDDEAFYTNKLESIVRSAGKDWPVQLLPEIGHIPLTLEPTALDASVRQVRKLHHAA